MNKKAARTGSGKNIKLILNFFVLSKSTREQHLLSLIHFYDAYYHCVIRSRDMHTFIIHDV